MSNTITSAASTSDCNFAPSVSCLIAFQPAYGVWVAPDDGSLPAIGTTSYTVNPNDNTTTSNIICNFDEASSLFTSIWTASGQQLNPGYTSIPYTVDSECNLVARKLGPQPFTGAASDHLIAITYPNTALDLGTYFDVLSATSANGSCSNAFSQYHTTEILYTESFGRNLQGPSGAVFWDLTALPEYLPGIAAASECSATFQTQPNTLRPATYLTSFTTLPLTSTDAQPASTPDAGPSSTPVPSAGPSETADEPLRSPTSSGDVQMATIPAAQTSDPFASPAPTTRPLTFGSKTLEPGGEAVTITSEGITQVLSIPSNTATSEGQQTSIIIVSGSTTRTENLASYICGGMGGCDQAGTTVSEAGASTTATSGSTSVNGSGTTRVVMLPYFAILILVVLGATRAL